MDFIYKDADLYMKRKKDKFIAKIAPIDKPTKLSVLITEPRKKYHFGFMVTFPDLIALMTVSFRFGNSD